MRQRSQLHSTVIAVLLIGAPSVVTGQAPRTRGAAAVSIDLYAGWGGYEEAGLAGVGASVGVAPGFALRPLALAGFGSPRLTLAGLMLQAALGSRGLRAYAAAGPAWAHRRERGVGGLAWDHLDAMAALGADVPWRVGRTTVRPFAEVHGLAGGGSWLQFAGGVRIALTANPYAGKAMAQRRRQAPAATLLGSVRDADDRPIPGTQVMIRSSALGAVSDSLGRYEITGVPPGQHGVVFAKIGYYRLELTDVDLAPPDTVRLDVRLTPRQFVITECLTSPPC